MALFANDISSMIFKRTIREDAGEIPMTGPMLMVLLELDGNKDLAAVSRSLQMKIEVLKDIISKLHAHKLVEKRIVSASMLNAEFFDFLKLKLSLAMGPIAAFIIEDETETFSNGSNEIPLHRAAELVDLLSRQIHRNSKRLEFQQAMVKKIKEIS